MSNTQNGNVPYYSDGDGSTTFRVPSLKCWVRGANGTVSEVGSYLAAGLPNITGSFIVRGNSTSANIMSGVGCFATGGTGAEQASDLNIGAPGGGSHTMRATLNASTSNSIYGNSATVQPESIVGLWLVKAYGVIVDTGQIDEQQYIDDRFAAAKDYTDMEVETGVPTGCVQAFAGNTTPQGWLLCDGSAVSRTQYSRLFAVIGTTYGAGDGSTTFNLPDLVDKFVQGNATSGTVKSAGLPNITGTAYDVLFGGRQTGTGALIDTYRGGSQNLQNGQADYSFGAIVFDAHDSNSIYGNSTTVQPPALTMRYIIKY